MDTVAERVKQRRMEKGITAADLARRAGISKAYLSEIENGKVPRPSADVLYRLATELGTTVADLLGKPVQAPAARSIPDALRQFAEAEELPEEDVKMLAQIRFRGEQPKTPDDWRFLYDAIKRSVRKDVSA